VTRPVTPAVLSAQLILQPCDLVIMQLDSVGAEVTVELGGRINHHII